MMRCSLKIIRTIAARAIRIAAVAGLGALAPAWGTTVQPPTFDRLVSDADYIVHGVVQSISTAKKPTARGFAIVTRVEFKIHEQVTGPAPDTLVLELWGGRVGKEALMVEGMPQFRLGDEEILFVRANGRSVCPLVGMMHGRYAVRTDVASGRRYVARNDGVPVRSTADVSQPITEQALDAVAQRIAGQSALGPAEFVQQIKAVAGRVNRER